MSGIRRKCPEKNGVRNYLLLRYICNNLETIKVEKQVIETINNKVSELTVEEIKAHLEHYKNHFDIIKEDCNNFWHNNSNINNY
jgi:hypothetical protein